MIRPQIVISGAGRFVGHSEIKTRASDYASLAFVAKGESARWAREGYLVIVLCLVHTRTVVLGCQGNETSASSPKDDFNRCRRRRLSHGSVDRSVI